MKSVRLIAILVVLAVLIYVSLTPTVVYAPTPRVILYLLASVFLAVFIGAEASTRFELKLPGFLFVTGGAGALVLGAMFSLTHLSKPDKQIVVAEFVDQRDQGVNLNPSGAIELVQGPSGLVANMFVKGSSIVLIFPEQLIEQQLRVRETSDGRPYLGTIKYATPPTGPLKLGKDLRQ